MVRLMPPVLLLLALAAAAATAAAAGALTVSNARTATTSHPPGYIPLTSHHQRMYTGEVQLGTPPQSYSCVFDSGSSDLWFFSANTAAAAEDASQSPTNPLIHYYNSSASSTARSHPTEEFHVTYGKGWVRGHLMSDTLTVGGYTLPSIKFGVAGEWSQDFDNVVLPLSCIVGLGFSHHNRTTLLDELRRHQLVTERTFVFDLQDNGQPSLVIGQPQAENQIGNTVFDAQHQAISTTTTPLVTNSSMWVVDVGGIAIDSFPLGGTCSGVGKSGSDTALASEVDTLPLAKPCVALIDSGTSFIGLPPQLYETLINHIIQHRTDCHIQYNADMTVHGMVHCRNHADLRHLPTLGFVINGVQFILTPEQYKPPTTSTILLMPVDTKHSDVHFIILGDVFMRSMAWVAFNQDQRQIGISGRSAPLHRQSVTPLLGRPASYTSDVVSSVDSAIDEGMEDTFALSNPRTDRMPGWAIFVTVMLAVGIGALIVLLCVWLSHLVKPVTPTPPTTYEHVRAVSDAPNASDQRHSTLSVNNAATQHPPIYDKHDTAAAREGHMVELPH